MGTNGPTRYKKRHRITVSLSASDHDTLANLSAQYDVSASWLVRHAVSEFVDRLGKGEIQLPLPLGQIGRQENG